ncbi:MAG: prepilin-type N-terminal cleavage/methylation domain-containing protein [Candidatus Falkowbacteria bacterium]|nr:prepilin-type N-terminal cleavage/methylation domain-containing protein [Candidatus Falkowbacteria bacterium]
MLKIFSKSKGFTLIELLVVVGIIAILSTLSFVFFDTARMSSRDARRVSDIKQLQLALKMYYNDTGIYPTTLTANSSITDKGKNYLLRVPANPTPRADNGCVDQDYKYTQLENGQRYSLSFCLGDKTDDLDGGNHTLTANGILNCPTGYVSVPGSYEFNTNDFCVMKWEAKCASTDDLTIGLADALTANSSYDNSSIPCDVDNARVPVSVSSGNPIGNISQIDAVTYCQTIGAHLMTNQEWMTITRNLENVTTNWSDGVIDDVGSILNAGNYSGSVVYDGSNEYVGGSETHDWRRTSYLSNGESIWDITGNIAEWLDTSCLTSQYYGAPGQTDWPDSNLDDYERSAAGPFSAALSKRNYIGTYIGCASDSNYFLRGGSADDSGISPGIFALDLANNSSYYSNFTGFRCVRN